jgi:Ca2+-binding EF-hand superfamily protein
MATAFACFDVDGKGRISSRDFRRVCKDIDYPLTDQDLQMIMNEADFDGDGDITLTDFMTMFRNSQI